MPDGAGPEEATARVVTVASAGTAVLVATSAAAAVAPDAFASTHALLSVAMFTTGTAALLWGYLRGLSRSRVELVSIMGLFFLTGSTAPPGIRRSLRLALAVEMAAAVTAAAIRPYSDVAFGILAPMFGLGLMAAWAGRHGTFPPRPPKGAAPQPR